MARNDEFGNELRRTARYLSEQASNTPQATEALEYAARFVSDIAQWWLGRGELPAVPSEGE